MLYLLRSEGQQVLIGKDVLMTVEIVKGRTVKLAFDAPASVEIDRPEYLIKKLMKQRQENNHEG
jgi:carbon storage regulator CsrA